MLGKFENEHKISLESYVALCKALGYTNDIKSVMAEPKYSTIRELDTILFPGNGKMF